MLYRLVRFGAAQKHQMPDGTLQWTPQPEIGDALLAKSQIAPHKARIVPLPDPAMPRRFSPSDVQTYTALKALYGASQTAVPTEAVMHAIQRNPRSTRHALTRLVRMGAASAQQVKKDVWE